MPDLVSLNLEYLILKLYQLWDSRIDISHLPQQGLDFLQKLSWLGILLSLVFLVTLVYIRLRLSHVEHEGWKVREDEEVAAAGTPATKNPRWENVMTLANSSHSSDWRRAILEADIMLFQMLNDRGYPGESVGEQLKSASTKNFATLDLAWDAHRVRNEIAHAGESYPLTERDAHATVDLYRRVFQEFDYI